MSRSKNAVKNVFYSMVAAVISLILTLITRKVILASLNIEMLGYESLFANIFSVLSLAEMGAGTVISYQLYNSVARSHYEERNKLISMYKYLYRLIAFIIAIAGVLIFFSLKYIVVDYTVQWTFIQKIYIIQLLGTIASYLLCYKRMLFIADQKEYVITNIDTILNFISQILKILVIVFWQNYIVYLIITVLKNVLLNIFIQWKAAFYYSDYESSKINKEDFKKRNIFKDIKNFIAQKIASIIYYNTDNILISMILGVSMVGIYSNYYVLKTQIFRLTIRIFNPIQASIGNFIHDDKNSSIKGYDLFKSLDIISFFFASMFACGIYCVLQPFIELWYGPRYLLGNFVVILFAFNAYMETLREIPYYFRSAFGQYEIDKKYIIYSAVVNILITISLGRIMGISGILLGTVVGMFFLWYSVIYFLYKVYFKRSIGEYFIKHIKLTLIAIVEICICTFICNKLPISFVGIIFRGIICVSITLIINILVFYRKSEFKKLVSYFLSLSKGRINRKTKHNII